MRRLSRDFKQNNPLSEYSVIHSNFLTQSRHFDSILTGLNQFDDQKKQSVIEMKKCINEILSSYYSNIINNCEKTKSIIPKILAKEKEIKLSAFAHDILFTATSIIQIVTGKNNSTDSKGSRIQSPRPPDFSNPHTGRPKKTRNESNKLDHSQSLSILTIEKASMNSNESKEKKVDEDKSEPSLLTCGFGDTDNGYVVCRICDETVPVSLIEDHMNSCAKAYNSASTIININTQLSELIKDVQDQNMNVKWPGPSQVSSTTHIPLLKIVTLVDQALQIDVNLINSQDELNQIINKFNKFKTDGTNTTVINVLKSVRPLLKQKLRACKAISNRGAFLRQTMLNNGSPTGFRKPQTQISDFDFIKRISKGAFASVYLARKKITGDIYAIKVIPKSTLKHDEHVKRVIDEKNILLQLRNPYIVKFCMYIIIKKKTKKKRKKKLYK